MDSSRLHVKRVICAKHHLAGRVNRLQSYIRPLVWSSLAPGHHGIRAPGASRLQGLEGHARYRLYPGGGPTALPWMLCSLCAASV
jgi:hypothetical protein